MRLTVRWNAPLGGGYGAYWLDPKGAKFGPAGAYLQHNVAEVKKLVAAAGYTAAKPLEFDIVYAGIRYGRDYPTRVETWQSMMAEAGIKANALSVDYVTEYNPKYLRAKPPAQFKGRNVEAAVQYFPFSPSADPLLWYIQWLSGSGAITMTGGKFPELDTNIQKVRSVTNFEERVASVHDLNRWAVDNMVVIPAGPDIELVDLIWKALRGPQLFSPWVPSDRTGFGISSDLFPNYWFEEQI